MISFPSISHKAPAALMNIVIVVAVVLSTSSKPWPATLAQAAEMNDYAPSGKQPTSPDIMPSPVDVADPLTGGSITGVGMSLGKKGNGIFVMQFLEGGVAEAAGIRQGDEIVSIDGKSIGPNPTIDGVVKLIRGPVNSSVRITIIRDKSRQTFTMTRVLFRTPIDGFCPARTNGN